MEKLLDIITKVVLYSAFSLLPLGWLYWVYLAVKFGGFIMFVAYFGDCDRLFRDNPITSVSHL